VFDSGLTAYSRARLADPGVAQVLPDAMFSASWAIAPNHTSLTGYRAERRRSGM
jgi:hypothetical protein